MALVNAAIQRFLDFPSQVQRSYDEWYRQMTTQLQEATTLRTLKDKFHERSSTFSKFAFERREVDESFNNLLFAGLYLLTESPPEDVFKVLSRRPPPWKLVHMCCFLTSPDGRLFVNGLYMKRILKTKFDRAVELLTGFLKTTVSDCLGGVATSSETLVNVVVSAALMGNLVLITALRDRGLPRQENEDFYRTIERFLDHFATTRPSHHRMFTMQPPNGDVASLTFRLLTFLKRPQRVALSGDRLARMGFVSTCKKDQIRCVRCRYESADLTERCDPASDSFHYAGCPARGGTPISAEGARLAFRLSTFVNLPGVDGLGLARNGLFHLGNGRHVQCFWCGQVNELSANPLVDFAVYHQQQCEIPAASFAADYAESLRILSQILCCQCRTIPANIILHDCCHLVICTPCFGRLSESQDLYEFCPRCGGQVRGYRRLYHD